MKTPCCANCKTSWSWKTTWKQMFTLKQAITCPYCEAKQYLTKSSRQKLCLPPMMFAFMNVPFLSFGVDFFYLSIAYVICIVCIFILMPFLYELNNENDPLW